MRMIAEENLYMSCPVVKYYTTSTSFSTYHFEVCVVLALDTRYYGRGASVLGYGHKMDSHDLRILMIHRPQWHDSRPNCTSAAGSSLLNPQASQRAINGRTKIWILVSARRRLEQAVRCSRNPQGDETNSFEY